MSKTVRYKLSEEEYKVVLESAETLGISVDKLAYQALAYVLRQARELSTRAQAQATQVSVEDLGQVEE